MPSLPAVTGQGQPLQLHDTSTGRPRLVAQGPSARMYVCGITPYDATHLGHAATYVTFDLVGRALRDSGVDVRYAQNVTDVDDPLFERAERDGINWADLADREVALFREDMTALAVIPPDAWVGVREAMEVIAIKVAELVAAGVTYAVPVPDGPGEDLYLDLATVPSFGSVSHWSREEMLSVFADRGGDPDREGKRSPLDPLLWRAERPGEPAWAFAGLAPGRPGWHVECTAIAADDLGLPFDVQGGGTDLIFPHHEMSSAQADGDFARLYVHQGMVAYEGEKMSKSRGNLVFVSRLRAQGVDPMAIRLVLLAHHYREDWEYTPDALAFAQQRLATWRAALSVNEAPAAEATVEAMREALADDLRAPAALAAVDDWAQASLAGGGGDPGAPGVLARALDALLGVRL